MKLQAIGISKCNNDRRIAEFGLTLRNQLAVVKGRMSSPPHVNQTCPSCIHSCNISRDCNGQWLRVCKFAIPAGVHLLHIPSCKWIIFLFLGCEKQLSFDSSDRLQLYCQCPFAIVDYRACNLVCSNGISQIAGYDQVDLFLPTIQVEEGHCAHKSVSCQQEPAKPLEQPPLPHG